MGLIVCNESVCGLGGEVERRPSLKQREGDLDQLKATPSRLGSAQLQAVLLVHVTLPHGPIGERLHAGSTLTGRGGEVRREHLRDARTSKAVKLTISAPVMRELAEPGDLKIRHD